MLKFRWPTLLLALALISAPALAGAPSPADTRFSQSVAVAERAPLGLNKLSSDQLAVLDALVRRDTATRSHVRADPAAPAVFSQRLSENERKLIGFAFLTTEEIARLDAAVERHTAGSLARTLLAPPAYVSRASRHAEPTEAKEKRDIHGSFSLSYGWGKGGYSERTGSMMMTYDDPAGRYSVTIGYSESHIKGPDGGRYLVEGPPYRP